MKDRAIGKHDVGRATSTFKSGQHSMPWGKRSIGTGASRRLGLGLPVAKNGKMAVGLCLAKVGKTLPRPTDTAGLREIVGHDL